jgi:hypothetical protein
MGDDRGMSVPALRMARYLSRLLDMAQRPGKTGGTVSHPEPMVSGVALCGAKDGHGETTSVPIINAALTVRYAAPTSTK